MLDEAKMPADRIFVLFPSLRHGRATICKAVGWNSCLRDFLGRPSFCQSLGVAKCAEYLMPQKGDSFAKDKAYNVIYERMFVMPPNLLIDAEVDLVRYLLRAVPDKLKHMLHELHQGKQRRRRIKLSTVWLRFLAETEQQAAAKGSKHFKVSAACTRCGHCIEQCPVSNLYWDFNTRLPIYRDNCQLCLRCYYNCPAHAIHAPKLERMAAGTLRHRSNETSGLGCA